jgi:hypothetical protein
MPMLGSMGGAAATKGAMSSTGGTAGGNLMAMLPGLMSQGGGALQNQGAGQGSAPPTPLQTGPDPAVMQALLQYIQQMQAQQSGRY